MITTLLKIYFGALFVLYALESITRMGLNNAKVKHEVKELNKGGKKPKIKVVWIHLKLCKLIKDNVVQMWKIL